MAYKQVKRVDNPILIAIGMFIRRNITKLTVRIITDVLIMNLIFQPFSVLLNNDTTFLIIVSIEKTNMKKPLIGTAR